MDQEHDLSAQQTRLPKMLTRVPTLRERLWDNLLKDAWASSRFKLLRKSQPAVVKSAYGVSFVQNWSDSTFHFYIRGRYGFFFSNLLSQFPEEFVFLDIGANQGLYSLLAAKNPRCQKIYAFEPVLQTFELLQQNLVLNECSRVIPVQRAISESRETVEIVMDDQHSGATSLQQAQSGTGGRSVTIETICAADLNALVESEGRPILIKLDVEGHEEIVLTELLKCDFFQDVAQIYYECDERWVSAERLYQALVKAGFTRFEKIGKKSHYDVLASRIR